LKNRLDFILIEVYIIKIIIRNGAKTISLQTLFGRLNNNKRSKNIKSPNVVLGDLITLSVVSSKLWNVFSCIMN
jgi:hypothetical protein